MTTRVNGNPEIYGTLNWGTSLKNAAAPKKQNDSTDNIILRATFDVADIGMSAYGALNAGKLSANQLGDCRFCGLIQTGVGFFEMISDKSDKGSLKGMGDMISGLGLCLIGKGIPEALPIGIASAVGGAIVSTYATLFMERKQ